MVKKKHTKVLNMIFFALIAVLLSSCGNTSTSNSNSADDSTQQDSRVILITGEPGKEITWRVDAIKRKDLFLDKFGEYVNGDSLLLVGEASTSSKFKIVDDEHPPFELEDSKSNNLEYQSIVEDACAYAKNDATKMCFIITFRLSQDGSFNNQIDNGSDLIFADSDHNRQNIPGHKIDLSVFGKL